MFTNRSQYPYMMFDVQYQLTLGLLFPLYYCTKPTYAEADSNTGTDAI